MSQTLITNGRLVTWNEPNEIIENGGHFLQEDQGPIVAEKVTAWLKQG